MHPLPPLKETYLGQGLLQQIGRARGCFSKLQEGKGAASARGGIAEMATPECIGNLSLKSEIAEYQLHLKTDAVIFPK
jgi:hypothetical protein